LYSNPAILQGPEDIVRSMRVFVYEFVTGGGMLADPAGTPPHGSLLAEGRAMVQAVTADLLVEGDIQVCSTRDARLLPLHPPGCEVVDVSTAAEERQVFAQLASGADWTLVIAPETAGALLDRARLALESGGRLLSPSPPLIEIAADKQRTADWLRRRGVPFPPGQIALRGQMPERVQAPAVLKPLDGCGSQEVRLLKSAVELHAALLAIDVPMRLEQFRPGLPASVAVLCGPKQRFALPACLQRLSNDGHFAYLGGRTPLEPKCGERARRLALAAVATLPAPLGYIGVDLVLGGAADGSGDCVIEINPRLTTSYVGLRAACQGNLAAAMLAIATGTPAALSFRAEPVEFDSDGTIRSSRSPPSLLGGSHDSAL
jgi:predicted ATP-grasp superfamily ATP-dependent carboligase